MSKRVDLRTALSVKGLTSVDMASSPSRSGPEAFKTLNKEDAHYYLTRRFSDPYDKEREVQPFYLKSLHDFYVKYSGNWDSQSAKLLEFGGGPVIYSLISAAPYVASIVHSDYSESNLQEVRWWKDKSVQAHNWIPYFHYVLQELEGIGTESTLRREEDLRAKLSHIVKCDVTRNDVLETTEFPMESFDVISSCFCLEAVANTSAQYAVFIERLSRYLKPGGYILSLVSVEESWYKYGANRLTHLYITTEDVRAAYEKANLKVLETSFISVPHKSQNILNDCKKLMFIACQKAK